MFGLVVWGPEQPNSITYIPLKIYCNSWEDQQNYLALGSMVHITSGIEGQQQMQQMFKKLSGQMVVTQEIAALEVMKLVWPVLNSSSWFL